MRTHGMQIVRGNARCVKTHGHRQQARQQGPASTGQRSMAQTGSIRILHTECYLAKYRQTVRSRHGPGRRPSRNQREHLPHLLVPQPVPNTQHPLLRQHASPGWCVRGPIPRSFSSLRRVGEQSKSNGSSGATHALLLPPAPQEGGQDIPGGGAQFLQNTPVCVCANVEAGRCTRA